MVDYFPSYEMVMLSDPRASWSSDQRHITDYRVGDVVRTFIVAYIPEAASEIVHDRRRYMDAKVLFSKRQYAEALREFQAIAPHFTDDTLFLNDLRLAAECTREIGLALMLGSPRTGSRRGAISGGIFLWPTALLAWAGAGVRRPWLSPMTR